MFNPSFSFEMHLTIIDTKIDLSRKHLPFQIDAQLCCRPVYIRHTSNHLSLLAVSSFLMSNNKSRFWNSIQREIIRKEIADPVL